MKLLDVWPENVPATIGSYLFTEEKIIEFASKFDPQYFHLDPVRAKDSVLGGLCASGWHVCSAWMQLNVAYIFNHFKDLAKQGIEPPKMGPAMGFKELKWTLPVYAGDTITYSNTFLRHVKAPNRDDRLLHEFVCEGVNQNGKSVVSFIPTVIEFV
jgi:acyl dehydratase